MGKLRRFGHHLGACYLEGSDILDKAMKVLAGLLFIGFVVCRWIAPGAAWVGYLNNPAISEWFERGLVVVIVGWGLIWVPFRRVEELEENHKNNLAETIRPLQEDIAKYQERDRLKLYVSCHEGIYGCHTTEPGASHHFFRLAVVLDWTQPAIGCFGKLLAIEKDGRVIRDHDVEKLPYSRSHEPDALNKTLNPGVREFLDVLVVGVRYVPQRVFAPSTIAREITLTTKAGRDVFEEVGEYKLTLALFGATIPTQFHELKFNWTGESTKSSLTLIK